MAVDRRTGLKQIFFCCRQVHGGKIVGFESIAEINPVNQVTSVKQSGTAGSCTCVKDIILREHGIYMVIHRKRIHYGPVRSLIIRDKELSYTSSPVHANYKLITMRNQWHDAAATVWRFIPFFIKYSRNIFPGFAQVRSPIHLAAMADIKKIICGKQQF